MTQKRWMAGLALCCCLCVLLGAAAPAAMADSYYVITGEKGANLRSTPENDLSMANVIAKVHANEVLEVLGQTGNWYRVNYRGRYGYVACSYVSYYSGTPAGFDPYYYGGGTVYIPGSASGIGDWGTNGTGYSSYGGTQPLWNLPNPSAVGSDYKYYGGIEVEEYRNVGSRGANLRYSPFNTDPSGIITKVHQYVTVYVYCYFYDMSGAVWYYVRTGEGYVGFINGNYMN